MSFAGLSLETATRRGGGVEVLGRADFMRVLMCVRLAMRVWARLGLMCISEVVSSAMLRV